MAFRKSFITVSQIPFDMLLCLDLMLVLKVFDRETYKREYVESLWQF